MTDLFPEDFRLTACMALLKWVLKMCKQKRKHSQRPRTGYEQVVSTRDNRELRKSESMFENEHMSRKASATTYVQDDNDLTNDQNTATILDDNPESHDCDKKPTNEPASLSNESIDKDTSASATSNTDSETLEETNTTKPTENGEDVDKTHDTDTSRDFTTADDDKFDDLVPNEGNYRSSSRAEQLLQHVPGEDESDDNDQKDTDTAKNEQNQNRCE